MKYIKILHGKTPPKSRIQASVKKCSLLRISKKFCIATEKQIFLQSVKLSTSTIFALLNMSILQVY